MHQILTMYSVEQNKENFFENLKIIIFFHALQQKQQYNQNTIFIFSERHISPTMKNYIINSQFILILLI